MKNFLPRNGQFFEHLNRIASNVSRGARILKDISLDYDNRIHHINALKQCEHEGDELTRNMLELVESSFITPIDHQDLFKMAKHIDDILDYMERCGSILILYKIDSNPPGFSKQTDLLVLLCNTLEEAVGHLNKMKGNTKLDNLLKEIYRLENVGDDNYTSMILQMTEDVQLNGCTPEAVFAWNRHVKLNDSLEKSIDAVEAVAHVIKGAVMKHQ